MANNEQKTGKKYPTPKGELEGKQTTNTSTHSWMELKVIQRVKQITSNGN